MKRILLLSTLFFTFLISAQIPQGISYQAIALDGSGNPVVSSNIGIQLSVLDNSASGTVLYTETHTKTTSAQGLFNLVIGMGTPTSGTFSGINWGTNSKFLKVELDATGGTSYVLVGTTQLLSVPYALYAGKIHNENVIGGSKDFNTNALSFITSTDAYVFSPATSELLSPFSWHSTPISGTPFSKSYHTFLTSTNFYKFDRIGSGPYQWISGAISGQPIKIFSSSFQDALIITSTNAYTFFSNNFHSVALSGTFVDCAVHGVLTSTNAYVFSSTSSFASPTWQSIAISGTPIKIKYSGNDGGTLFLTTTNAYLYGPDSTSAGPGTEINYSWKTIPLASAPILD